MAVIKPTVYIPTKGVLIVKWSGLTHGDTGLPFAAPQHSDRSVQVYGTFGSDGVVTIQGANDPPQSVNVPSPPTAQFVTLHEANSYAPLVIADATKMWEVEENPTQIRPSCSGSDSATSVNVVMTMKTVRQ